MSTFWRNISSEFIDGDVDWKYLYDSVTADIAAATTLTSSLATQQNLAGLVDSTNSVAGSLEVTKTLAGVSAATSTISSSIKVTTTLTGITAEASAVLGSLNVIKKLQGSVLSDALVLGAIYTESSFQSLVATESIVSGSLSVTTTLQSNLETISIVSGSLKSTDSIQGSIAETLIVSGSLNVDTELQSTVIGSSNLTGNLGGIAADVFRGIIDSSSGLLGTLVIDVKLIGTASSLLTISGQLNINSQLQGITLASSEVTGWLGLGLWIFVAGTSTSIATIIGSLDKQPGLVCTSVGYSNGECYLTLVPDFEAATLFWRPQSDIIETLEWNTAILKSFNGTEQRIKVRHAPRQFFKMRIFLGTDKLNSWYDSIIHTWQKQKWLIPIWNEYVEHTEDINIKDTTITVDTTFADFRSSNKAIVWKSATEYEILVVDTKTDSQLSLSYAILNQFTGSKYIIPVRTAYLTSHSKKSRYRNGPSFVDLVFSIYDNINLTDYVKTNDYDNITLLAQPAFMDDTYSEESDADIIIEDFETGIFKVRSNSPFNILTQGHKFFNDTKEDCWNFRRFLHSLNGRQKTIIIPTFRSDVTQIDDIEVTDTHVVIENINLASNMGYNNLRKYIGFYFEDGTLIVRKITGISGINSVSERINFDYNLDLSSAVESGDCKICFVDKCRLASDSVELQWQYAHRNECNTNLTRVI